MSKSKSETARANGAKSHGPVTPEGRAKSSANSRRHGLTAKYALLPGESEPEFDLLLDDYIHQFRPATGVEMELIEIMVVARWRLRRLLAVESHLFDMEIVRQQKPIDREFEDLPNHARLAWVFQKLADQGHSVALMIRYEGSLNRFYDKAFRQLLQLQSNRQSPSAPFTNTKIRNEPTADPDPALDASTRPQYSERSPRHSERSAGSAPSKGFALVTVSPTPQEPPFQRLKTAFAVNPTIPVRDSVSWICLAKR